MLACIYMVVNSFIVHLLRLGRNGIEEVKSHPWFNGLDFGNLRGMRAPHLPKGSSKIKGYLKELQVRHVLYVCTVRYIMFIIIFNAFLAGRASEFSPLQSAGQSHHGELRRVH